MLRSIVLSLICAAIYLLTSAHEAQATAHLHYEGSQLQIQHEGLELTIEAHGLPAHMAALRHLVRNNQPHKQLAQTIANTLKDAFDILEDQDRWEVWPPTIAPLGLLPDQNGDLLLENHIISYTPPIPSKGQPPYKGDLLAFAPFHSGFEPIDDDPGTVLNALRSRVRRLRLLPRNDTNPASIEATLRQKRPGLVWLRARPAQAFEILPLITGTPIYWSWPAPDDAEIDLEKLAEIPKTPILLNLVPVSDSEEAAFAAGLMELFNSGMGLAAALQHQQLAHLHEAPHTWAGRIVLGHAQGRQLQLKQPSVLQRLFHRRPK